MSSDFVDVDFGLGDEVDLLKKGADKDKRLPPPENANPDDVEFARDKVRQAMEIGLDALQNAAQLSQASDDVRAFKVVSSLIDSVSHAADKLVRLRENVRKAQDALPAPDSPGRGALPPPNNTTIFVGSPGDVQKILDGRMKTIDNE